MYDFKEVEKKILASWKANKIFEKSLQNRKKAKRFVWFDGPPTANGAPHIGNFLTRIYKDLFGRYKTMQGFFVLRKSGWDTHGLPVEIEIEKQLGFKSKKDIDNYGIAEFNKRARESVWKYKSEWIRTDERGGFWIDFNDSYITYEKEYMETLWWIIKQIWEKGLLYPAHKVVHFCVRCGTPLSTHEVAQGYKKVTENSVTLKFKILNSKLKTDGPVYILAWTTTPWTLPGNIALAVGENIDYVLVKKDGERFILAKDVASRVISQPYTIEKEMKGRELVGLEYEPLFKIKELESPTSYKVYPADFVATTEGTGVVHTAVMYGEDDYNLGVKVGLPKVHTVNENGKFLDIVGKDLAGLYVKAEKTESMILEKLKSQGKLFKEEDCEHDYPFCWRCDSPLLYYAKDSWFIKMSAVNKEIMANNATINWIPEHIKEGRFGQWLKEGKDWAFSRERYWGTPLPIWQCNPPTGGCGSREVIGSIKEMVEKAVGSGNKYYILRHGFTTRNEEKGMILSSVLESDKYELTEKGRKQIQSAAKKLKKEKIDLIFCSPFLRTKQTAEIAAKELGISFKIDDRLREISHGLTCEDRSFKLCTERKRKISFNETFHEDGESWDKVRQRMAEFMSELESKYKDKKILIVSHGDPLWLLKGVAEAASEKEILEKGSSWYPKFGAPEKIVWQNVSRNEFGELDLHRPFIDEIKLNCSECGGMMKKIPELIDVWFDSGAMPFAQWHWPFENEKIFKEQFPADFIVEAIDQTRGWFYTLLAISTLLGRGAPYRNVMSLAHVLDSEGKKMSKSKGNVVFPSEVMDKFGADATRWYFFTVNAPSEQKLFAMKDVEDRLHGFISTFHNCLRFYELYESGNGKSKKKFSDTAAKSANLLDKWILSRLNGLVRETAEKMDNYDSTTAARLIEKFVIDDLSNWWLRRSRKRPEALGLLRYILIEVSKLSASFIPFLSEEIYLNLTGGKGSVHFENWPKSQKKLIDQELEKDMGEIREFVATGLALRKEKQIKVRQPLRSITVKRIKNFDSDLENLMKEELNVKEISYDAKQPESVKFDFEITPALRDEGYIREFIRKIQDMRKEAGYKPTQKIYGQWHSVDGELSKAIKAWENSIKKEILFYDFENLSNTGQRFDIEGEFEVGPAKKIWLGLRK